MSISGWILLDKPEGMSSNKAMCIIRHELKEKTGYVGTLDPFAQGMLPIAIGEARKFIPYVNDSRKEYTFTIKFGEETDTLDLYGKVTQSGGSQPLDSDIISVLDNFRGDIQQIPPMYSAIKINGCRAYKLAVQDQIVTFKPRAVTIYSLEYCGDNKFRCECSRGTYIRSLVRDICHSLNTFGHTAFLRREKISFLKSEYAITMESIQKRVYNGGVSDVLLPIEFALDDIPAVILSDEHIIRLQNGLPRITNLSLDDGQVYKVISKLSRRFCGIVRAYDGGNISPVRMCSL